MLMFITDLIGKHYANMSLHNIFANHPNKWWPSLYAGACDADHRLGLSKSASYGKSLSDKWCKTSNSIAASLGLRSTEP